MAETLDSFFSALCQRMGWEPTPWRLNVLKTMAQMEGYPSVIGLEQTWNPLDTTMPHPDEVGLWNKVGVRIYPDQKTGVEATAQTMEQNYYPNLRKTLQTETLQPGTDADLQTWGWSGNLLNTILNAMGGGGTMPNGTIDTAGVPTAVSPWERDMGVGAAPSTTTGAGQGAEEDFVRWLKRRGFSGYIFTDPDTGEEFLSDQIPTAVFNAFLEETSGTGGLTPEEQEKQRLELAGTEIEQGLWPYTITTDEFDTTRQWYLDQVAAGKYRAEEAVNRFYAWLDAQKEVTTRAETLMEREQKMLPVGEFPQTEEGGLLSTVAERYNVPWTPLRGVPAEQLTSPQAAFSQFQNQMGISAQAPELVSYNPEPVMQQYGAAVAGQSQGAQAALDFVRQMLARRGIASS